MRLAQVTLNGISYTDTIPNAMTLLASELEAAEVGHDSYSVSVIEMAEEDFKKLPEFDGF